MVIPRIKLFSAIFFASSLLLSQVIISEVMYDPDSSDSEFVEIYNTSSSAIVDLTGWTISNNKGLDVLEFIRDPLLLSPLSYAVILESDYDTSLGVYNSIIPDEAIWVGGGGTIGSGGLKLNDAVGLRNSSNTLIDSVEWTNIALDNYSIERIRLDLPNTDDNWASSEEQLGTPGAENSVTPLSIDGAIIGDVTFNPKYSNPLETIKVKIPVSNSGLNAIDGTVNISFNGNIIGTKNVTTLSPGQSTNLEIPITGFSSGRHLLIINYEVLNDNDLDNNSVNKQIDVSFEPGTVKINEFLAKNSVHQTEFVELVSFASFSMAGWKIADKSNSNIIPPTFIESGDYIVLADNNSLLPFSNPSAHYLIPYDGLPTLNNSSETVYLLDNTNTVIDSLAYGSGWSITADTSAEKLRPELMSNDLLNWRICSDSLGITPGYENSTFISDYDGEILSDLVFKEPQFPKNYEPIQITIPVTNNGAEPMAGNLIIYDDNDLALETYKVTDIGYRDTLGFLFELQPLPSGIHPLTYSLEIADDSNLANNLVLDTIIVSYTFGDVLLNEFLPGPSSNQAEFVELLCNTDVTLFNWSIEDATHNAKTFNGGNISQETFVVLSEDIAFEIIIPTESVFVEVEDFPSLNNYGDAIYLRDFTGTIIDSLIYTTWWELETSVSTEKIHPQLISADSTAWLLSIDSTGMTPGRPNSVVVKDIDGMIVQDGIFTYPEHPEGNNAFQLTTPVMNNGLQPISGTISVDKNGVEIANYSIINIDVGETIAFTIDLESLPSGIHSINIILNIDGDENLDNNSCEYDIKVSYEFGDVTINEFCADPEAPLFEFIELYTLKNIDLNEWGISDNRKNMITFGNQKIGEKTFIVLGEEEDPGTSPLNIVYYSMDNFPSFNNSGDGIYLYDFTGKVIDSLIYDNSNWSIESGLSTEKIFPGYISNDPNNWQVCTAPFGATLGLANSVLLQNINGTIISELTLHYPDFPHPSESIAFNIGIKNTGIENISGEVSLLLDDAEIGSTNFLNLSTQNTALVTLNIEPLPSGRNVISIVLEIPNDMNSTDNIIQYDVNVSYPFGAVIINEFLAKPDSTQAEFVEVFSFSDIDLSGWSISDNTYKHYIFGNYFSYAELPSVVTTDTLFAQRLDCGSRIIYTTNGWPTLNNESDGIFLYDPTGVVIDSLSYNSDWPITEGRSTEKYRPEFESVNVSRWGIAVNSDAMTPGHENSIFFDELPKDGSMVFDQNPFSPDGDGVDDELLIKYKLPFEQGIIKLQIFDVTGRLIATPYWNVYFPQEGILRWDGLRDNGEQARIGIYILKLSARNTSNSDTWEKVKTVVLAKQL